MRMMSMGAILAAAAIGALAWAFCQPGTAMAFLTGFACGYWALLLWQIAETIKRNSEGG